MSTIKEDALKILVKNFPDDPKQKIENCADEWSKKQVTTSGLVNYYKAYYNSNILGRYMKKDYGKFVISG